METYKRIRASKCQMDIIAKAMEVNADLNKSVLSSTYSRVQRQKDWNALSAELNKTGGVVKSVGKWQKCWSDYKSEVRRRCFGKLRRSYLSPLEVRVAKLMGLEVAENAYKHGSPPLELEISKVKSIKDMSSSTSSVLEESMNRLTDLESSNSTTVTPKTSTTFAAVKIEPEEMSEKLLEANKLCNNILTQTLESNDTTLVPKQTPEQNISPKHTLAPKQVLEDDQTLSELSLAYRKNKIVNRNFNKFRTESSVIVQKVSTEASTSVVEDLETKTENQTDTNLIAEALHSLAKAFETIAENQKVQLSIEDRRTALLEKLFDHFCSK